jgi:hypothetical protein
MNTPQAPPVMAGALSRSRDDGTLRLELRDLTMPFSRRAPNIDCAIIT